MRPGLHVVLVLFLIGVAFPHAQNPPRGLQSVPLSAVGDFAPEPGAEAVPPQLRPAEPKATEPAPPKPLTAEEKKDIMIAAQQVDTLRLQGQVIALTLEKAQTALNALITAKGAPGYRLTDKFEWEKDPTALPTKSPDQPVPPSATK